MLDVKEAAQIAFDYFNDLYADAPISNVMLEEIERSESEGESYWLITLGFTDESQTTSGPLASVTRSPRRYKVLEVDAKTGEVKSMKIRSVENA